MRASIGDLPAFAKADLDFHSALAEAAGNAALLDLLDVVRSLLQVYANRAVSDEQEATRAVEEHAALYEALEQRDPDAAASAMAVHMATASERLAAETAAN